jgi:hypothetical protein
MVESTREVGDMNLVKESEQEFICGGIGEVGKIISSFELWRWNFEDVALPRCKLLGLVVVEAREGSDSL